MEHTYKAVLRGNQIEWLGEAPVSPADQPLSVKITIVEQDITTETSRGPMMAEILEKLAKRGQLSSITDPVKWQRELRQERELPGRKA